MRKKTVAASSRSGRGGKACARAAGLAKPLIAQRIERSDNGLPRRSKQRSTSKELVVKREYDLHHDQDDDVPFHSKSLAVVD